MVCVIMTYVGFELLNTFIKFLLIGACKNTRDNSYIDQVVRFDKFEQMTDLDFHHPVTVNDLNTLTINCSFLYIKYCILDLKAIIIFSKLLHCTIILLAFKKHNLSSIYMFLSSHTSKYTYSYHLYVKWSAKSAEKTQNLLLRKLSNKLLRVLSYTSNQGIVIVVKF